jgi:hypothetical protein
MLLGAIEAEVDEFLVRLFHRVNAQGRREVVRNGYFPGRQIQKGLPDWGL